MYLMVPDCSVYVTVPCVVEKVTVGVNGTTIIAGSPFTLLMVLLK